MKKKYHIEVNKHAQARATIATFLELKINEAKKVLNDGVIELDEDWSKFKEFVESLEAGGNALYDYDRIQLPKVDGVDHSQRPYT